MRGIGLGIGALVLVAMPFASACYRSRVESCRGPIGDFSGISNVAVTHAITDFGFETASASVSAELIAQTTLPDGSVCVDVHAELRDSEGGLVDTLDTPIQATVSGELLQTTEILFYRSSSRPMTVFVTALGTTVSADVTSAFGRDASFFAVPDAGPAPRDAGHDVGFRHGDAGTDADASTDVGDASADASLDDASRDDAGADVGP